VAYTENFTGLRVWWISNIPSKTTFRKEVQNLNDARLVLETLRDYDLHLEDLIEDNAGGLEMLEGGEWIEYEDENGEDIWASMEDDKELKGDETEDVKI